MERYKEYKESKIQWIKKIPSEWEERKAKYVFSVRRKIVGEKANDYELLSLTLKGVIKRDMDNPTGKFPSSFESYQEVHKGDFIFCLFDNEETPRTVGISEYNGMITGAYDVFLCDKKDIINKFLLYYYLTIDDAKLMKPIYRGLRKTIPFDSFMRYRIPLPPLSEQQRIVDFLEDKTKKIDQYIAEKEKQLQLLEEYKQSLIANAVTKGLNPDVKMKDSGIPWIGMIPEHWEVKKLSQACCEHFISNKNVHHQNLLSLSYGKIIRKDINTTDGLLPASFDTYQIVEPGNIILRLTDLQNDHKSLRVGFAKEEGIITSAYVCISLYNTDYTPQYVYNILHSYDIKKLFYSLGGGLRQNLNWQGLKKIDIPLPSIDEQQAIVSYIEEKCYKVDSLISDLETEISHIKEYKQRLIADCVTGQIKV